MPEVEESDKGDSTSEPKPQTNTPSWINRMTAFWFGSRPGIKQMDGKGYLPFNAPNGVARWKNVHLPST